MQNGGWQCNPTGEPCRQVTAADANILPAYLDARQPTGLAGQLQHTLARDVEVFGHLCERHGLVVGGRVPFACQLRREGALHGGAPD